MSEENKTKLTKEKRIILILAIAGIVLLYFTFLDIIWGFIGTLMIGFAIIYSIFRNI